MPAIAPLVIEPLDHRLARQAEADHRAMPAADQPYLVTFMGMMDYVVVSIHDTEEEAQAEVDMIEVLCDEAIAEVAAWQALDYDERRATERPVHVSMRGMTREAHGHYFQVRQQHDLDALVDAIQQSHRADAARGWR